MRGPLAYAFWHQPADAARDGGTDAAYEEAVATLHRDLAAAPPAGFVRSWSWRLPAPPWWGTRSPAAPTERPVHLDWYVIDDLAALGALADAAVDGRRAAAHDAAARRAGPGAGGLYRLVHGAPDRPPGACPVGFADKERGEAWETAVEVLAAPGAAVWMRQLVLGPGPEMAVIGPFGPGWPPTGWSATARLAPRWSATARLAPGPSDAT